MCLKSNTENRIDWIDYSKGIGMILVILGHLTIPQNLRIEIYTFHMPLFFFLSGYVFSIKDYDFKYFFKRKIKSLILPGIYLSILTNIVNCFIQYLNNGYIKTNLLNKLIGIFIEMRGSEYGFIPWYLMCLFLADILMYFLIKNINSQKKILIVTIVLSILAYSYSTIIGKVLPWSLDIVCNSILFTMLGYLFKQNVNKTKNIFKKIYIPIYLILNISIGFINYFISEKQVDMYTNSYGIYIFYVISAIMGILFIIAIAKNYDIFKFILYIGKNSLIYYCIHNTVIDCILLFIKKIEFIKIDTKSFGINLIILVIVLFIIHFLSYIISEYFPFLIGKKRREK